MINKFGGGIQIFYNTAGGGGSQSGNPLELLVSLGIDKTTEKTSLDTQIKNLRLNQAKIDAILSDESVGNINNQIKKLRLNLVKLNGQLNIANTQDNINKQLKTLKLNDIKINVDTSNSTVKNSSSSPLKAYEQESKTVANNMYKNLDEVKKKFEKDGFKLKIEYTGAKEAEQAIKRITAIGEKGSKNVGKTVSITPSIDTSGVKGFSTDKTILDDKLYKDLKKNIKQSEASLDDLKSKGKLTTEAFKELNKEMSALKNANKKGLVNNNDLDAYNEKIKQAVKATRELKNDKSLNDNIRNTKNQIKHLAFDGVLINPNQIKQLKSDLKSIKSPEALKEFNRELDKIVTKSNNVKKLNESSEKLNNTYQNLLSTMTKLERVHPKTLNSDEIKRIRREMDDLNKSYSKNSDGSLKFNGMGDVKKYSSALSVFRTEVNRVGAEAAEASRNSMKIIDAFKVAMEKFPVWMAASTLFFSTIRTAKEFMSIIIDIDTKMTDLKKVMSDGEDFGAVFDRATLSAQKFGQSISQALDSYIEFARQGYKGDELGALADSGLIASNVGEMTSQKASEYMTASLVQWKKDAKESMGIIDSWNEISNNYATTTEKLAAGQARAGATARAMGLDFDQLNAVVGTVTASTKQSGDEVGNFVKNVLPRLVGAPAQNALKGLGISLTDDAGNMRDVIDVYTEVANKVKGISDTERIAVTEGLAGKFHISRMQALLDDLGSADSMYRQMYESSKNSAGSAMQENEKYMKSLEARIGLARVEVEKLALAIGEAFLTEGMIESIKMFSSLLSAITKVIQVVGALPVLLAMVGAGALLLSTRFRGLVGSIVSVGASSLQSGTGISFFSTAMTKAGLSADVAKTKLRTLAATAKATAISMGVIGVASIGVGWVIEKLVGILAKQRAIQEEIKSENTLLANSYKDNESNIDSLITRYGELESAINSGNYTTEESKEYLSVQNELAQLLPQLKIGEDAYGNAMLNNSNVIKGRIGLIKEQVEIEKELERLENRKKSEEKVDTANKTVKYRKQDESSYKSALTTHGNSKGFAEALGTVEIKNIEQANKRLQEMNRAYQEELDKGNTGIAHRMKKAIDSFSSVLNGFSMNDTELKSATLTVSNEFLKVSNDIMSSTGKIDKSGNDLISSLSLMVSSTETDTKKISSFFSNLNNDLEYNDGFVKSIASYQDALTRFNEDSSKLQAGEIDIAEFEKSKKILVKSLNEVKAIILSLAKDNGISTKGLEGKLDGLVNSINIGDIDANQIGVTFKEATANAHAFGEGVDSASESLDGASEKFKTFEEQLSGVSQSSLDSATELLLTYEILTAQIGNLTEVEMSRLLKQKDLTSEEEILKKAILDRNDAIAELDKIMPGYTKNVDGMITLSAENIKAMQKEKEANEILLKAMQKAKEGQTNAEQDRTIALAKNTKERINSMITEIQALEVLTKAFNKAVTDAANGGKDVPGAMHASYVIAEQQEKIDKKYADLTGEKDALNGLADSLKTSLNLTTDAEKAKEKSNKETEKSAYVTDKFKKAMERLNTQIEKQQSLQANNPKYSKAYLNAVRKEIKLQKEKTKLLEKQSSSLKSQINSGKILQKGNVKISSGKSTSQSPSSNGGSYSGKYSTSINKYSKQYKVDPNLIAAIIKHESGFNPNITSGAGAGGLMQLMPGTAKSLGVSNVYNADQNIKGGTKYFSDQLKKFNGNIEKALRAYNAGPNAVNKSYGYTETNNYVKRVTDSYNKYLKSATGSVSKASKSATKNIEKATIKSTKTVTRKLAGWSGQITSGYGSYRGNTGSHYGIDIAGKRGQKVDSNVNGTVTSAGRGTGSNASYGNFIKIKGANGKDYLYAHLDSISVSKGQQVKIGQKLGAIGNTGTVQTMGNKSQGAGSHLHYEEFVNGKRINPMAGIQKAKGNHKVNSGSFTESGYVDSSQSAVDNAISAYENLLNEQQSSRDRLYELIKMEVDSIIEGFEHRKNLYDTSIDKLESQRSTKNEFSQVYRDLTSQQKSKQNKKLTQTKDEKKYIDKRIADNKKLDPIDRLSNAAIAELREQSRALGNEIIDINNIIKDLSFDGIQSKLTNFENYISNSEKRQEKYSTTKEKFVTTGSNYRKYIGKEQKEVNVQLRNAKAEKKLVDSELKKQTKNQTISNQKMKELTDKARELDVSIADLNNTLVNLEFDKVNSKMESYAYEREKKDYIVNRESSKRNQMDATGTQYQNSIKTEIAAQKEKQKLNRQELNYLTTQLENGKLNSKETRQVRQRMRELKVEMLDLTSAIQSANLAILDSQLESRNRKISDYSYLQEMSEIYQSTLSESSAEFAKETARQQQLISKQITEQQKNAQDLLASLSNTNLSYEDRNNKKEEYKEAMKNIANLQKAQYDAQKALADKYVALQKKVIEKQRDLALQAIDDERKAYQKLINDKIKQIDKTENETSFNEERDERQKEIEEKRKKLDSYALDESQMGKAEKKKLQDELTALEKDYAKWLRQYNNEQQKESLQEQLEAKEEALEKEEKKVERHYENILEDERKWAKMSEDIIKGNVATYIAEFAGMESSVKENLEKIGESIGQNIIDELIAAQNELSNLQGLALDFSNTFGDLFSGSVPDVNGEPSVTTPNDSDAKRKSIASKNLTVKSGKDGSGSTVGTIAKGEVVQVLSTNGGYAKVQLKDGSTGYVSTSDLTDSYTSGTVNTKVMKTTANVFKSASLSSDITDSVPKGATVTILGTKNGFTQIKYGSTTGWVKDANIDQTSGKTSSITTTVNGNSANSNTNSSSEYKSVKTKGATALKSTGASSASTLTSIPKGTSVKVTGSKNSSGYVKATYGSKTGWINTKDLEKFNTGGYTGNLPNSGALAILHKKELILNENQTSDMLKVFNIFDKMNNMNPNLQSVKGVKQPDLNINMQNSNDGIATIEKLINIENFNGTQQEVDKLSKNVIKGLKKMGVNRLK